MPFISSARKQYGPQGRKNTRWRRYPFTSHTFTPAGSVGQYGPTLSQLTSSYSSASWINGPGNIAMNDQGIQLWPVPSGGTYRITAAGGKGGGANGNGGIGAVMRGDFSLQAGQTLRIIVGQRGYNGFGDGNSRNGGGGGASVVSIVENGELLIIAGGGAGITDNTFDPDSNRNARTGQNSTDDGSYGRSTYWWTQGSAGPNWDGGGGGSWGSNGESYGSQRDAYGRNLQSSAPIGGLGRVGSGSYSNPKGGHGGFGGGGGSGIESGAPGGGGGFRGGNAGYSQTSTYVNGNNGTGGGSYNNGSNQSNSISSTGDGYVTIQKL
jgi:hypothetical protein